MSDRTERNPRPPHYEGEERRSGAGKPAEVRKLWLGLAGAVVLPSAGWFVDRGRLLERVDALAREVTRLEAQVVPRVELEREFEHISDQLEDLRRGQEQLLDRLLRVRRSTGNGSLG